MPPRSASTARRWQLEPAMTGAGIALANVLETLQRPQEAESQLRRCWPAAPDCAPAAYNLALLLLKRDECDEAEQWLLPLHRARTRRS